jgi:hypothetical protein
MGLIDSITVPILSAEQVEVLAEQFLGKYDPAALTTPRFTVLR